MHPTKSNKGPFRIAEPIPTNINVAELASWVNDGNKAYGKFTLQAYKAKSLSINFNPFYLPEETEMFIYNEHGKMITGPVTASENNELMIWGSAVYKGDILNIELVVPSTKKSELRLVISNLAYGYKDIFAQKVSGFGQSGACNINVLCSEGNGWANERSSIALIALQDGSALCSGVMVNNTCNADIPYLLTANHCFTANGGQNVANWRFYFQAWSATCTPSQNSNGLLFNGSTLRANWAPSDFALVQLNQTPPANSGINYAGWSRSTTASASGAGIHHPSGDVMKISTYTTPVTRSDNFTWNINGQIVNPPGDLHWIVSWNRGVTEGGSSGSPLFDQNHRIIGQLGGGPSGCGNAIQQDAYGRFDNSWAGGGTNATRLSNWLDPSNSGATTTNTVNVANLFPNGLSITGSNTICGSSATYSVNGLGAGVTIIWSIGAPSAGSYSPPLQNVASLSPNGSQVTVNKLADGNIKLIATVRDCDGRVVTVSKPIALGVPPVYYNGGYFNNGYYQPITGTVNTTNNTTIPVILVTDNNSYSWLKVSGSSNATWVQNSPAAVTVTFNKPVNTSTNIGFRITTSNACGSRTDPMSIYYNGPTMYTVSPNPASSDVTVEAITATEGDKTAANQNNTGFNRIQVIDKMGVVVLNKLYPANSRKATLSVAQLRADVYIVRIYNNNSAEEHKIVIQR